MVSLSRQAAGSATAGATAEATGQPVARLNARVSAYLADSVILFAFILVFFVIGGAQLLIASNRTDGDPPDPAYYAFIAVFLGGPLISWTAFNLLLMHWRGQSAGMYVIGIKTVSAEEAPMTVRRVLLRWFGLHPLLFHPLLLPLWTVASLLVVSFTLNDLVLVVAVALALLCLVSPLANFILLVTDPERRALHDRLARTLVVHLEQP
jgi:uncharacterized RDD family membrane protein YckC